MRLCLSFGGIRATMPGWRAMTLGASAGSEQEFAPPVTHSVSLGYARVLLFSLSLSLFPSSFLSLFVPLRFSPRLSTLRAPGRSEEAKALRVVVYALAANAIGRYARVTGHGAAMNRLDDGADAERSARY